METSREFMGLKTLFSTRVESFVLAYDVRPQARSHRIVPLCLFHCADQITSPLPLKRTTDAGDVLTFASRVCKKICSADFSVITVCPANPQGGVVSK